MYMSNTKSHGNATAQTIRIDTLHAKSQAKQKKNKGA